MDMKERLLALEDTRGSGRVSLARFYSGRDSAEWQFSESVDYLRQLGALDESDPKRPRVIVPNYIGGANNCLASAGLYDVCCISECEALMGELEREIAAPAASAAQIANAVSWISSSSVDAPRNLTTSLMGRLDEVASRNGGRVPIHGRLFTQWMHHAFPNECPHPHVSGTTAPKTTVAFKRSGGKVSVTAEERAQYIAAHTPPQKLKDHEMDNLVWSDHEELLSYDDFNVQSPWEIGRSFAILVSLLLLLAFLSVTAGIARSGSAAFGGAKGTFWVQEKYMV